MPIKDLNKMNDLTYDKLLEVLSEVSLTDWASLVESSAEKQLDKLEWRQYNSVLLRTIKELASATGSESYY